MTLCIAAIATLGEVGNTSAVFCSDSRIETTAASSETAFKFRKVSAHWAGMYAGTVGRADELLGMYTEFLTDRPPDGSAIMDDLREVAQKFKRKLAAEYVATMTGIGFE